MFSLAYPSRCVLAELIISMQSIKEIMDGPAISNYSGSEATHAIVASEIEKRWGKDEVTKYDPYKNALTFRKWLSLGYRVRRNEKAIRSVTFVEAKDEEGRVTQRIKRPCFLFYYKQVEPAQV